MSDRNRDVIAYARPAVWRVSLGFWSVLGSFNAASEAIDLSTGDQSWSLWEPISWELTSSLAFALLTPFIITFALRVRLDRRRFLPPLGAHVVVALVFSLLHVVAMVAMRKTIYALAGGQYDFGSWSRELPYEAFKDVITYSLVVGLTYGFDYYRRYRERELMASQLQTRLAEARLESLEHQIQPHFLFNTLNMISATMHHDVPKADRMISRLSDLLRMAVQRSGRQEVPLREEIEMLQAYRDIMLARFEERLRVEISVEPGLDDLLVPPLLLQPLVENAVKHGVGDREAGGTIRVGIDTEGDQLRLCVADDGAGTVEPRETLLRKGLGLSSTAERLKALYGDRHTLTITNGALGGLELVVRLPARGNVANLEST